MGNPIKDKNWSGSNESLPRFMENTRTTKSIMDRQGKGVLQQVDEGAAGEEQCRVVLWRDGTAQSSETCGNISVQQHDEVH